jgi:hypothetical protein
MRALPAAVPAGTLTANVRLREAPGARLRPVVQVAVAVPKPVQEPAPPPIMTGPAKLQPLGKKKPICESVAMPEPSLRSVPLSEAIEPAAADTGPVRLPCRSPASLIIAIDMAVKPPGRRSDV